MLALLDDGWLDHFHSWLNRNEPLALWLTGVATAVLAAGVFFAWGSLRDAKRTRHAQLVVDLSRRWDEQQRAEQLQSEYTEKRLLKLVEQLYGQRWWGSAEDYDPAEFVRMNELPSLIETIGVLVSRDALTLEIVFDLWAPTIIAAWEVWRRPAERIRELTGAPDSYRQFQKLAEDLMALFEASTRARPIFRRPWKRRRRKA
jgi:hypothetical protein